MNVAIIGAGLIGKKRAGALPKGIFLSLVCDIDKKKAKQLANEFKCKNETDWKRVVRDPHIQAVIISTVNKHLSPITKEAVLQGKHVLVEKPGGRNLKELDKVANAYKNNCVLMYGYNHRYHPAIVLAKEIVDSKKYGKVLFIRAKYGHGGRLGYEKEWRFNKDLAGGGELLDQGSHLIDLVNYFCGEMPQAQGLVSNLFWKASLEDSAFFILKNKEGTIAHLSATCVEWKNIFSFEIMLKRAKIQIDGLGRSYGREKLTLYKMKPEMGPPDVEEFLFDEEDNSWRDETKEFFNRIRKIEYNNESIRDAIYVLEVVEKLYNTSSK